jgi:hypothetical protein
VDTFDAEKTQAGEGEASAIFCASTSMRARVVIICSIDLTMMGSGFGAASMDRILAAIANLFALAAAGSAFRGRDCVERRLRCSGLDFGVRKQGEKSKIWQKLCRNGVDGMKAY